jgi:uncharacterized protein with NAD-binding domain and iron-sulfur cluster
VASFDVPVPVAGLLPGDVVEHGLHAWFQHYHELLGLMDRAGIPKPPLAGRGVYYFNPAHGHFVIEGGPLFALNSLPSRRDAGLRADALAFARLIAFLDPAPDPLQTDRESAIDRRMASPNARSITCSGDALSLTRPIRRAQRVELLR